MRRIPSIAVTLILVFLVLPLAVQASSRAVIANDNAASAAAVIIPRAISIDNMEISTIEPGEPQHLCTTPGPTTGAGSIWYRIEVPGGTLIADTAGSEFSTAVSVYPLPFGDFSIASLQAAGCSALGPNGVSQARLSKHLGAGAYLVQISRIVGLLGANDLAVSFAYTPDLTTKGDRQTKPINLTAGRVSVVKNVQYAFATTDDEVVPPCNHTQPGTSVWFTFTTPFNGFLNSSAEGSLLSTQSFVTTGVTLTVFDSTTPSQCATTAAQTPLIFEVFAGQTILFRLTANNSTNLSAPSVYKFSVIYESAHFLPNGGFEQDLTGWKLKNATNGDGITTTGGEVAVGTKSFKFVGSPSEATSLSTNVPIPSTLRLRNSRLILYVSHRPLPSPQILSWKISIVPLDGSPPKVLKHTETVSAFSTAVAQYLVEVEQVKQIKLTFKNKNASGSLVIDGIDLWLSQTSPLRNAAALPLAMPVPAAPR